MSHWFLVSKLFPPFSVLWRNEPMLDLGLKGHIHASPVLMWLLILETQLVKPLCVVSSVSAGVYWVAFSKDKKSGWGHSNQPWFVLFLSSAGTTVVTTEPVSSAARKLHQAPGSALLHCWKQGWTGAPWKKKGKLLGLIKNGCEPWADPFSVVDGEASSALSRSGRHPAVVMALLPL